MAHIGSRITCQGLGGGLGFTLQAIHFWDNGKENGNYRDYRDYVGYILGLYWGNIGIMEKKMETTIQGLGFRV